MLELGTKSKQVCSSTSKLVSFGMHIIWKRGSINLHVHVGAAGKQHLEHVVKFTWGMTIWNSGNSMEPFRLIPEQETKKRALRQSLAFFAHPDNEVLVECIDGSGKYPPITAQEDTVRRLNRTYTY